MKTTIREAIQNLNILLNGVYQHALKNPKEDKKINHIKWEGYRGEDNLSEIMKKILGGKVYISVNYKNRTLVIEDVLILKFKMKKITYGGKSLNYYNNGVSQSVVSVEISEDNHFLDMTIEEFLSAVTKIKNKELIDTNKSNQDKVDYIKSKLGGYGLTYREFEKLTNEFKYLDYEIKKMLWED